MDISRIKKKDLRVWLPLMEGVEVQTRHLPQGEYDAISAATTVTRFDPKSHRRIDERDEKRFRSELARAIVVDWRGITDDGTAFPCTPENIDYLMLECTEFRLLVLDAPLSLEKMLALEKAAAEKNSSTTSGQSLISQA